MSTLFSGIYKSFIIAGIIGFVIGWFSKGNVSLNSYIAGYSILILAIMMILTTLINNTFKVSADPSVTGSISSIIMVTGPFILMLATIAVVLYLMIKYKTIIVEDTVSQGYYSFNNVFILILFLQLAIVYMNVSSPTFEQTGKISKMNSYLLYLLGVLGSITSVIIYTILHYFTTDGFTF